MTARTGKRLSRTNTILIGVAAGEKADTGNDGGSVQSGDQAGPDTGSSSARPVDDTRG